MVIFAFPWVGFTLPAKKKQRSVPTESFDLEWVVLAELSTVHNRNRANDSVSGARAYR